MAKRFRNCAPRNSQRSLSRMRLPAGSLSFVGHSVLCTIPPGSPNGLAKDPSRRPQSAVEVAHRLQLPSGQATTRARPGKSPNRKALLVGGVVAAAVLALAGMYFGVSNQHPKTVSHAPTNPEKSIAVLPFENRSEEKANAYFADGIQDEILTRLSKIADLKVISR